MRDTTKSPFFTIVRTPMAETPRTTLADGTQIYPEHRDILKDGPRAGQQKEYVVLAPTALHHKFRDDVIALLDKHAGALDAAEMLALSAHLVGQILAMQDLRKLTLARAMEIVATNIEQGNGEVLAGLSGKSAGSA